jgi:hypothetical protein
VIAARRVDHGLTEVFTHFGNTELNIRIPMSTVADTHRRIVSARLKHRVSVHRPG